MKSNKKETKAKKTKKIAKKQDKMKFDDYFCSMLEDHYYQLYTQGNNEEILFHNDEDRLRFKKNVPVVDSFY